MDTLKNDQAAQNEVETTTQVVSPTTEAPTTQTQTPQAQAKPETVPDVVPDDIEEQRRAFQEMRQELKRLKEEKTVRSQSESAFKVFRPQPNATLDLAQGLKVEDYTDPLTGEVNRPAYNAATEARQARMAAVQAQSSVQEQIDENNARSKHPELFADPEIEEEIASRWYFNRIQGKNVSVTDIADSVAKRFSKAVSRAEKSGMEKALTEVSPKEQAALQASSQTSAPARQAASQEDMSRLQNATRFGSEDAIAARMKGIPWANK